MTKEEALKAFRSYTIWALMEKFTTDELQEMIDAIVSTPSLPSDLDEAAEEYAYNNWEDNDYHTGASEGLPFDAIGHTEKCFKAGAGWMAGKFVLVGGEPTGWFRANDGSEYATGLDLEYPIKLPVDFYVRKK